MADGDNLVLGTPNTFNSQTFLQRSASGPTTAFAVANLDGGAIVGTSANHPAVEGASNTGPGVSGLANSGAGVQGSCGSGTGVAGRSSTGTGVDGTSTSGSGVTATSTSGDAITARSARAFARKKRVRELGVAPIAPKNKKRSTPAASAALSRIPPSVPRRIVTDGAAKLCACAE